MLRTHTCGELDKNYLEKEVVLCGWVDSRRDHGKIIFIDLRDRYGVTQIVFVKSVSKEAYNQANILRNEAVVKIKGKVGLRPKGTVNSKIQTGHIEVCVEDIFILNNSEEIPFSIEDNLEVSEEIRLSHRFLDLRRRKMLKNIDIRHKIIHRMRNYFDQEGFLEIETPLLTKSTPEGARDFLVPSRINPSSFYALPQSPQLFKQILMVSGVDKYFQIARCFRDEDLRKDRQPEFTQLDLEISFCEEEDIYSIMEKLFYNIFREVLGVDIKIPFPRISYSQAQEKYDSDKPDLGGEDKYRFGWVTDFPLFYYNEEEKRWDSEHHPFTAPSLDDLEHLDKDPSKVRSRSYDLVLNGQEIGSGSVRIHSFDLQNKIFSLLGMKEEEIEKRFGFFVKALKYGAPPHGGFALGLDRFLSIITESISLREVMAFPKTQRGFCPLTGAPSEVDEKQLRELGIDTIEEEE